MNYYRRNLGDYAKKCGRLTMLQHGAYNQLIDAIYDRETFPTLEEALEWTWASNQDERDAVIFVLSRYFTLQGDRYIQNRIAEEIEQYQSFCEKQKENGKQGGRPKKKPSGLEEKPSGLSNKPTGNPLETQWKPKKTLTTNQLTTNQLTTNHNSLPASAKPKKRKSQWPDGFKLDEHLTKLAVDYWTSKGRTDLIPRVAEIFEHWNTWCLANGRAYVDWNRAWGIWYQKAVKIERQYGQSGQDNRSASQRAAEAAQRAILES